MEEYEDYEDFGEFCEDEACEEEVKEEYEAFEMRSPAFTGRYLPCCK